MRQELLTGLSPDRQVVKQFTPKLNKQRFEVPSLLDCRNLPRLTFINNGELCKVRSQSSFLTFGKKICQWCVQHEAAQRGELPEDAVQPVMTVPWAKRSTNQSLVTHALVGINAAVFLGWRSPEFPSPVRPTQQLMHWGANRGLLTLGGEWWRLFTCMFLHIGVIHLAFNMWCLWDLGALAESLYGHWTFASVYLISGVAGSVASVAWHPGTVSAGASGAIFGIAGALIASFYLGEFSLPRAGFSPRFAVSSCSPDTTSSLGRFLAGRTTPRTSEVSSAAWPWER